ncbi:MAG: serpin family protein, partial [Deltaproteobacteria bacterium]|nr:serpin family protein [Deltaproteobacteria bacterium]
PYKLHTANALWVQKGLGLLKNYQELVRQFYGGEARNIDFSKAQKAAKMINTWIEEKTHHKISGFFSPESFSKLTWLVLTNAIYFKGMWEIPFDKEQTKEEEFQIHKDKKIKVPMMRLEDRELKFQYAETEKLQLLEMPYKGDELSMLLLLPKNNDLKALETKLTLEKLKTWKGQTKYEHVFIYLPKFIFKRKYKLHPTLSHMGMPTSFTTSADFSGIFGKLDIFIDSVLHEAFVDVNEEGTEAAAATALSDALSELLLEGPRLFTFRADHPFLFFIQERRTGNILFMGRVEEPVFEAK